MSFTPDELEQLAELLERPETDAEGVAVYLEEVLEKHSNDPDFDDPADPAPLIRVFAQSGRADIWGELEPIITQAIITLA